MEGSKKFNSMAVFEEKPYIEDNKNQNSFHQILRDWENVANEQKK